MSESVERVARAMQASEAWSDFWHLDDAKLLVQVVFADLTEQGIPIEKLLSGEMVAVQTDLFQRLAKMVSEEWPGSKLAQLGQVVTPED